jgi:HSP20 family molecular chaperone IbpA
MSRIPLLSNPLLLGFDQIERVLDRVTKSSSDGYPPYNIEKIADGPAGGESLRIVLAVAGFTRDQLEITVEDSQLTIHGRQDEPAGHKDRVFLHRGIAARQFLRTFVLADGFEVRKADLDSGLLTIDVARPEQSRTVRRIDIGTRK